MKQKQEASRELCQTCFWLPVVESLPKTLSSLQSLTTSKKKEKKTFRLVSINYESKKWTITLAWLVASIHKRQKIEQSFYEHLGMKINHFYMYLMNVMFQAFSFFHDGFSTSLLNFSAEIVLHAGVSSNQKPFFWCMWKSLGDEIPWKRNLASLKGEKLLQAKKRCRLIIENCFNFFRKVFFSNFLLK